MSLQASTPDPSGDLEFPFSEAEFKIIAALVYERSGIVLGPHKRHMVYSAAYEAPARLAAWLLP